MKKQRRVVLGHGGKRILARVPGFVRFLHVASHRGGKLTVKDGNMVIKLLPVPPTSSLFYEVDLPFASRLTIAGPKGSEVYAT